MTDDCNSSVGNSSPSVGMVKKRYTTTPGAASATTIRSNTTATPAKSNVKLTSTTTKSDTTNVVIVGMGDMAYGLCRLYQNHNYVADESNAYKLYVTKPGLDENSDEDDIEVEELFHDTNVPILRNTKLALMNATIVILAIPAGKPLREFMDEYGSNLADDNMNNVVLVDVANPDSIHDADLPTILESSIVSSSVKGLRYVKAFNDNGAVDLLLHDEDYAISSSKKLMVTSMCGKDMKSVKVVESFAKQGLGFDIIKIVPYNRKTYKSMSANQNAIGKDYLYSIYITLFIFALTWIYAIMRYNVHKGYEWFHLPIQVTNKAVCWTALYNFALCQVPGIIGRFYNMYVGKMHMKPNWLITGFHIRKPLGIISLWLLGIHILMSMLLFNPKYYGKFFIDPEASSSKLNRMGEASFFFAIFGSGLYAIMGVCSLPSVGNNLTRKAWEFVYGPIAWFALCFGTAHVLIMGVKGWVVKKNVWPGDMPPITMISVLLPMLVLFMKLVQFIVCRVVAHLRKQEDSKMQLRQYKKNDDYTNTEDNTGDDGIPESAMITPSKALTKSTTIDFSDSGSGESTMIVDTQMMLNDNVHQLDMEADNDEDTNYSA